VPPLFVLIPALLQWLKSNRKPLRKPQRTENSHPFLKIATMKSVKLGLLVSALSMCVAAFAQQPVLTSFSQNGLLICSNLEPNSLATVEWASSLSGPWQSTWDGLEGVTADSNGVIQVSVPMFYRVSGFAAVTNPPPADMALVSPGTFTMGDALDGQSDATPTVNVYLSGFYMDTNLVDYSQWMSVYSYATNQGYSFSNVGAGKATNQPVQEVDWFDTVKWSNARSQQAGLTPVYYTDAGLTQVYTNGEVTPYANWTANGYRLPTEAEWEKAARGGLSGQRFPWGDTISESQANYQGDTNDYSYDLGPNGYNAAFAKGAIPYTSPVGSFMPNGYGLYDMAGNVDEWCWDWFQTPYAGGSNPTGPTSGTLRVFRGGDWLDDASFARCATRDNSSPSSHFFFVGFRCVKGQ
jgi:formylglycine-generating enzyme